MRPLLVILLLQFSAVSLAMGSESPSEAAPVATRQWVRTVDGWEPLSQVLAEGPAAPLPSPHPFLVAALVGLGSMFVLVAFERRRV